MDICPAGFLTAEEADYLLLWARQSIAHYLEHREHLPRQGEVSKALQNKRSAFVTLRKGGDLRGCIGYADHRLPLINTVQENAVNAATRDPRFPRVTDAELPELTIEISVLGDGDSPDTPFSRVGDINSIRIGIDGLCIKRDGGRSGLLLPQVASERGWNISEFLNATCQKAGLEPNAWEAPNTHLYRFTAQVFGEV